MAISLYEVTVPGYLQTLGALADVLDRGAAYCKEKGHDADELVAARLYPDMLPLSFQVVSAAHHSVGAIEAARTGVPSPPTTPGFRPWSPMRAPRCGP